MSWHLTSSPAALSAPGVSFYGDNHLGILMFWGCFQEKIWRRLKKHSSTLKIPQSTKASITLNWEKFGATMTFVKADADERMYHKSQPAPSGCPDRSFSQDKSYESPCRALRLWGKHLLVLIVITGILFERNQLISWKTSHKNNQPFTLTVTLGDSMLANLESPV